MTMVNAEMYDALVATGAPDDKARAAAVAMCEESLKVKGSILSIKDDIANINSDLHTLKWMTGLVLVSIALPVIKIIILPILYSVF